MREREASKKNAIRVQVWKGAGKGQKNGIKRKGGRR